MGVVLLVLVAALSLLGWWLGLKHAGWVAAGALFALALAAGLWWRGRTPGFTPAEKRQIFGHWFD